jgi:outer membrane protein OmpA-like peptidoglycan-associated protein
MSQWPVLGVLLLALAGLFFFCIPHDANFIQQDVLGRSTQALKAAGVDIPIGGIGVDGRDITLMGVRGSSIVSDQTRDMIARVWGVRSVSVKVLEPPPGPAKLELKPEAKKLEVDLAQFLEGKNIRFAVNSDVIHPDGRILLDQVYSILATAPAVAVDITGHTDSDGEAAANLDLSKRRAAAVKRYLAAKGIAPARLETEGFGSTKPVVPNDTPENKAKNRRIEFHASGRIPGAAISNK